MCNGIILKKALDMKTLNKILIVILILAYNVTSSFVLGQEAKSSYIKSDSIFFESPALFICNVQFPKDYKMENSFPLLIGLHGGGGSYESFKNIWKRFENPQFILATPQAPYKWLMGDKIGYDWSAWPSGDLLFMQKALKLTSKHVEILILSLKEKYNLSEVYLMGFSQGSIIAQIAGIENQNILNGIIILSGPEINHPGKPEILWPSDKNIQSATHLRVFIGHGKSDELVDFDLALKSKEQYAELGYNVSLFESEGGHEITSDILKEVEKWIIDK